jgi:hypothetical protein
VGPGAMTGPRGATRLVWKRLRDQPPDESRPRRGEWREEGTARPDGASCDRCLPRRRAVADPPRRRRQRRTLRLRVEPRLQLAHWVEPPPAPTHAPQLMASKNSTLTPSASAASVLCSAGYLTFRYVDAHRVPPGVRPDAACGQHRTPGSAQFRASGCRGSDDRPRKFQRKERDVRGRSSP